MKALRFILITGVMLCASLAQATDDVSVGDPVEAVYKAFGQPMGYLKVQDTELLYYPRGNVKIADGEVVLIELISEDTLAARDAEASRERERRVAEALQRRADQHAEGLALKEKTLSDVAFTASSPEHRFAFWRAFAEKYPTVDVSAQIALANAETVTAREDRERELALERQMLELRERVAQAERRAADAEREAQRSRERTYYSGYSTYVYPYNTVTVVRDSNGRYGSTACVTTDNTPRYSSRSSSRVGWTTYDRSYSTPYFSVRGRSSSPVSSHVKSHVKAHVDVHKKVHDTVRKGFGH